MRCHGLGADHCCYVDGAPCRFLEEGTVPGRRWACGLRRELGSWERVHADPRYRAHVQPMWDRLGDGSGSCGGYPGPGVTCGTCGARGDG